MFYVLYYDNGNLKKATVNSKMYEDLKRNPNVSGLQSFASSSLLESEYSQVTGKPAKKLLYG